MLCQAFTATAFSCFACSLPSVLPLVSEKLLCWAEIRSLTWPLKKIQFLCLEKLSGCFCSMLWASIHLYCEVLSDWFCSLWLSTEQPSPWNYLIVKRSITFDLLEIGGMFTSCSNSSTVIVIFLLTPWNKAESLHLSLVWFKCHCGCVPFKHK